MAAKVSWFERRFQFDFPVGLYPDVLERLRGTPVRLEEKLRGLAPAILRRREGATWSIQENAGHLIDSDEDFGRTALHPRLQIPMRLVDMLAFTAAHHDYHLARMTELMRLFQ